MASDQQHMQRWLRGDEGLDHAHIVKNAGCAGIADDCFHVLGCNAVDDGLHRATGRRRIDQIHLVSVLDRNTGSGSQPLRIVEGAALGDRWTTLLAGETRVERWIQKKNAHNARSITDTCGNPVVTLSYRRCQARITSTLYPQ